MPYTPEGATGNDNEWEQHIGRICAFWLIYINTAMLLDLQRLCSVEWDEKILNNK
jgi:hypothetical protein